ncbi:MAG: cyclic nucleotide-binding domain-containing protein [Gammaproteobacteria bacterium]|nr:cyclic nucleotide-binding domain-containing protein [Gammaproteobacteria bacterium]
MTGNLDLKEIKVSCSGDKKKHRADCMHCSIRHLMLFSPLDIESFSSRLKPISHMISDAKTRIYHQGQPPLNIFSIRSGFVKLTYFSDNGQQRIVRLVGPGASIGLEALLGENYN